MGAATCHRLPSAAGDPGELPVWVPGRVCGPRTGGPMPLTPGAPTSGGGRRRTSQLEEREDACLRVIVDAHADLLPQATKPAFTAAPRHNTPPAARRRPAQEMTCCRGVPLCPLCTRESRLGEPRGRGGRAPRPPHRPESSLPFPVGYARVVFLVFLCFFITTRTQDKI